MPFGLDNLTPEQKKLAMYGIPVVGGLVLFAKLRKPAAAPPAASSGAVAGPVVLPSTSAVDAGQLSTFESGITDALSGIKDSLSASFSDALASSNQSLGGSITDALAGVSQSIHDLESSQTASPPPPSTPATPSTPSTPATPATPAEPPPRYSAADVRDLFFQYGKQISTPTETAQQRLDRITRQLNNGDRTIDQVRASIQILPAGNPNR